MSNNKRATNLAAQRIDLRAELDKRGVIPREKWYDKVNVDWTRRDGEGKYVGGAKCR